MKNLFLNICAVAVFLIVAVAANAQIRTPAPSPASELKQTVGLTEITINYSRPSAKGRAIFAKDGVVPFGAMWRTGANSATKITFGDDVKVGGQDVKKGSYALFTKPDMNEWTIMLFNYDTPNAGGYGDKTAVATFTAKPKMVADATETFTITVNDLTNTTANIDLMWEKTKVSLPVQVEVDKRVMADIDRVMAGPGPNDYAAAANYLFDTKKDLNKALEYIQKANAKDPRYWNVRTESLILAALNRNADAIKAAEKSLALAKEAKDDAYIRMNEKSIAEWSKKK
ncbi:MAG: DUF2911 domain-containing protein [Saprospiraceae bacterium]